MANSYKKVWPRGVAKNWGLTRSPKAGDSIAKLVEEDGGPQTDIEEAIRCELHIGIAA